MFRIKSIFTITNLITIICGCDQSKENAENTGQLATEASEAIASKRIPVDVGIVKKEITKQNIPLTGIIQPVRKPYGRSN